MTPLVLLAWSTRLARTWMVVLWERHCTAQVGGLLSQSDGTEVGDHSTDSSPYSSLSRRLSPCCIGRTPSFSAPSHFLLGCVAISIIKPFRGVSSHCHSWQTWDPGLPLPVAHFRVPQDLRAQHDSSPHTAFAPWLHAGCHSVPPQQVGVFGYTAIHTVKESSSKLSWGLAGD